VGVDHPPLVISEGSNRADGRLQFRPRLAYSVHVFVLYIRCDSTFLYPTSSPYRKNTILLIAYTMDGRTMLGEIKYRITNGHVRPFGETKITVGAVMPLVEELAKKFLQGWFDEDSKRTPRAA
jgi:hypothetical protein